MKHLDRHIKRKHGTRLVAGTVVLVNDNQWGIWTGMKQERNAQTQVNALKKIMPQHNIVAALVWIEQEER